MAMLARETEDDPSPLELVLERKQARDVIQDLWGAGYTVTKRQRDPFEVPQNVVPRGMAYQWANKPDLPRLLENGWSVVPFDRHEGLFAPAGTKGDVEVYGTVLIERSKAAVDAARSQNEAKAHKLVDDWAKKYGAQFSGGVRVWTGDANRPPEGFHVVGDADTVRTVIDQSPYVPQPPVTPPKEPKRVARHPWLRWLFDLISVEQQP